LRHLAASLQKKGLQAHEASPENQVPLALPVLAAQVPQGEAQQGTLERQVKQVQLAPKATPVLAAQVRQAALARQGQPVKRDQLVLQGLRAKLVRRVRLDKPAKQVLPAGQVKLEELEILVQQVLQVRRGKQDQQVLQVQLA